MSGERQNSDSPTVSAATIIAAEQPNQIPPHSQAKCRQKSLQVATGFRVARRDARKPTSSQSTTDAAIAIGYRSLSPKGAPTASNPGAANTPAIRPTAPLHAVSNSRNDSRAIAPAMLGTIRAANGPNVRIRLRYQRGPSMSGADVTPGPRSPGMPEGSGAIDADRPDGDRGGSEGAYESTTMTAYDVDRNRVWHHAPEALPHDGGGISDMAVVALAGAVVLAVWSSSLAIGLVLGAAAVCVLGAAGCRWRPIVVLVVLLVAGGAVRSDHAWNGLAADRLGAYVGWARLVDDPKPFPSSTRVVFDIEGERFELWSRGRAQQQRIDGWRGGDVVAVSGDREPLDTERARRVASQHVVGEFILDWAGDIRDGSPVDRASNQVRSTIERGASWMPVPYGPLFRGLVIGDDRDQPAAMIDRFRASGLSHLTAVSGQNVSFLLAACGPILVRLRPRSRWVVTVALISWFVALTRFEPSILRAGAMAVLSATAYMNGRERSPVRLLSLAVLALVIIDPLLVWSVGFWLSVGATAGVCAVGPVIARRLERIGVLAVPLGITLGAQVGVALPSLLVFGRLPLVSIPANLLAVPVAGAVMLYGMPAALIAGMVPIAAPVVMLPALLGTKWVDAVAVIGARVEPEPPWVWIGWAIVLIALMVIVAVSSRSGKNRGRHDDPSSDR